MLSVLIIRHGATAGSARRAYSGGGTDEPLSQVGAAALACIEPDPSVRRAYTSGMARADETARILFPNARLSRVRDLREMDFGAFEGKTFRDLADDARYRAWVEANCEPVCPEGEGKLAFIVRVTRAFCGICADEERAGQRRVVLVVHAGTIRAILSELARPRMGYFDVETEPGGAWEATWDGERLACVRAARGAHLR